MAINDSQICIIGAGVMGHGIAQVAATAEFSVILVDKNEAALKNAEQQIAANLEKGVSRGKLMQENAAAAAKRIRYVNSVNEQVAECQLVIEAVPEDLSLKQKILSSVSEQVGVDVILATNTSSLSVKKIADVCKHPERVLGMHFFNPPYALKLLELVHTELTSEAVLKQAIAYGEAMQREIVVVRDSPGFASSRLGVILGLEAIRMVEQGVASPEDIDRAMEIGYKHPMGPLRLTDVVGLDVRLAIADYLYQELGGDQYKAPQLMRDMVAEGKLGKKSGQGFYRW